MTTPTRSLVHTVAAGRRLLAVALATALACASAVLHAEPAYEPPPEQRNVTSTEQSSQPLKDAIIKGKILGALAVNPNVSMFDIDVAVDNGVARLGGAVDTGIERDLAVEIARGIDDVREVRSDIALSPGTRGTREAERRSKSRTAGKTLDDGATTAAIKSRLLANRNTGGMKINVTTRDSVVTLTGTVKSEAERDLAGRIAENTDNVARVRNELTVAER